MSIIDIENATAAAKLYNTPKPNCVWITAASIGPIAMPNWITREFIDMNAPRNSMGASEAIIVATVGIFNPWAIPKITEGINI